MRLRAATAPPRPNPIRVIFVVDHMNPNRNTDCRNYDACLDVAIERDWDGGFSCGRCTAFVPARSALRKHA